MQFPSKRSNGLTNVLVCVRELHDIPIYVQQIVDVTENNTKSIYKQSLALPQTIQWIATVAAHRYAEWHKWSLESIQPIAVHLLDEKERKPIRSFLPEQVLLECIPTLVDYAKERVKSIPRIRVDVIGPKIGINSSNYQRQRTLFERLMYTPRHNFSTLRLRLENDANIQRLKKPPTIYGNFCAEPIMLRYSHQLQAYICDVDLPADADIFFVFLVDGLSVLNQSLYTTIHTSYGNLHYLRVRMPQSSFIEFENDSVDLPMAFVDADEDAVTAKNNELLLHLAEKEFRVYVPRSAEQESAFFQFDWRSVVQNPAETNRLNDVHARLKFFYGDLCTVFSYYSNARNFIDLFTFLHILQVCKVYDKQITSVKLQTLYFNAIGYNRWLAFDKKVSSNPGVVESYSKFDPFAIATRMYRAQFVAAIVALALAKYPSSNGIDAIDCLVGQHIMPYALSQQDDINDAMIDRRIQYLFRRHSKQLLALFARYATQHLECNEAIQTMSLDAFERMCYDFNFVDAHFTRLQAVSSFVITQDGNMSEDVAYAMTLPEFLNSLIRIAAFKFAQPELLNRMSSLLEVMFPSLAFAK